MKETIEDTNQSVIVHPDKTNNFADLIRFAREIKDASFIEGSETDLALKILAGQAWGLPAATALFNIDVINDVPMPRAGILSNKMLEAGILITTVHDFEKVDTVTFHSQLGRVYTLEEVEADRAKFAVKGMDPKPEPGDGKIGVVQQVASDIVTELFIQRMVTQPDGSTVKHEVTVDYRWSEAVAAGLTEKHNWKSVPRDMMWNRALSRGYRRTAADLLEGKGYSQEELNPDAIAHANGDQVQQPILVNAEVVEDK